MKLQLVADAPYAPRLLLGEKLYRSIFENAVIGILVMDRQGRIVATNDALPRMLGYRAIEAINERSSVVAKALYVVPEDRFKLLEILDRKGVVRDFETQFRRQDGSIIDVALSARLIDDPEQPDLQHIGFVDDISERVKLRHAISEREAGLANAQRMARLAHIITGPNGDFESWSATLSTLLGCCADELPQSTRDWMNGVVDPQDRELYRTKVIQCAKSNQTAEFEYRIRRTSGDTLYVRQNIEPVAQRHPADDKRWFSTIQDVTELRLSEERLRRSNRIHSFLSAIASATVRIHDARSLFREACRIAVNEGGFAAAWVGEIDPATLQGTVIATQNMAPVCFNAIEFSAHPDAPSAQRVASRACRQMQPVLCNDIETEENGNPSCANLLASGHRSFAAFPLMVGGIVRAVLVLNANELHFFDANEVRLLSQLANDLAFALDYIHKSERLDYLALYDVVTGLPNSAGFRSKVAEELSANADPKALGLALIDIEGFTSFNEAFGREAGDRVLQTVAERLQRILPSGCSVSRTSADTFAIAIAQDTDFGATLRDTMAQVFDPAFMVHEKPVQLAAQAGLAASPADGIDAESLFQNAELALKSAKAQGQNLVVYRPEINVRLAARAELEAELRRAERRGEFVLYYQPLVEMEYGKVVACEALIRWQHPVRGLVSPAAFIDAIEETDMAVSVGEWVLNSACRQIKTWHDAGHVPISVSVNISARQFADDRLIDRVAQALKESGLPARWLTLELTEGIVMRGAERFIAKLNALKALGVRLSLDDFGTGYSSLSYLKRFPLDQLKIDQSFIRELVTNPDDAAIVRAVISVGHSMGLELIAEGVETESQLQWLRRNRCEKIQGYFFSRPLAVDVFEDMLAENRDLSTMMSDVQRNKERTLLIVDDEKHIGSALTRLLRTEGYQIMTALSAAEGLEILARHAVDVVISDHRMPNMTGAEFLGRVRSLYPDTVRILFSGQVELDALIDAVNRGEVYRFLLKPWDDEVLKKSIRDAFRYRWLTHQDAVPAAGALS